MNDSKSTISTLSNVLEQEFIIINSSSARGLQYRGNLGYFFNVFATMSYRPALYIKQNGVYPNSLLPIVFIKLDNLIRARSDSPHSISQSHNA